jgi:signal transduction histidine kinase/ActR/RegA family two-component response regulator
MDKQPPSITLHNRLAALVFRAAVGFALLISLVSFAIELTTAYSGSKAFANQLLDTVEASATVAAYADNETIAEDVISGLMRHEVIHDVLLTSNRSLRLGRSNSGDTPVDIKVKRQLPALFGDSGSVGQVVVTIDAYAILKQAARQLLINTINSVVLIGLTAWLVLRLVRSKLSNRLTAISHAVIGISRGKQRRLETPPNRESDELTVLTHYINGLLEILDDKLKAEQALNASLSEAKAETERASNAKSEFLAYLSHELRHPMNVISIAADLAIANDKAEDRKNYLQGIQIATRSMLAIVNEVLDHSRIASGKQDLVHLSFQLESVLDIVHRLHAMQAETKGLALEMRYDSHIPARLIGDPVRLGQVLTNLVSNALKFTREGRVRIEAEQIGSTETASTVRFIVSDTGIGIDEEHQRHLFQPFECTESPDGQTPRGAGLGLVISRRLVCLMGGDISVCSTVGKGSDFSFTLELAVDRSQPEHAAGPREPQPCPSPVVGMALLLVDDSEINRILAATLLKTHGFRVDTASGGEEAVDKVVHQVRQYRAVLMDLKMPGMDGFEATRLIRRHVSESELPIVALTAHALSSEREKCLASGFNDFMTKPIDITELIRCLERQTTPQPSPTR